MRTKRYIDVMTAARLRKARFHSLTPYKTLQTKADRLFWNLWNQFGLTPEKVARLVANGGESERPDITDYAWTPGAKTVFYSHPFHKEFVRKLRNMRGMTWGMFVLNFEPCDYDTTRDINGIFRKTPPTAQELSGDDSQGVGRGDGPVNTDNKGLRKGKKTSKGSTPTDVPCKCAGPGGCRFAAAGCSSYSPSKAKPGKVPVRHSSTVRNRKRA